MRAMHPRAEGGYPLGRATAIVLTALLVMGGIVACDDQNAPKQQPVAIHKDDTCFVCGMYIENYPGPRAEAYVLGRAAPLKFGSTRDFFAYVLQPENAGSLQSLFVQDTARLDWRHPSSAPDSFIDARKAYYVAFQPLAGAMGPTFAPFADTAAAERFIATRGGVLLRFDQITPALVSGLTTSCPSAESPFAGVAKGCRNSTAPAKGLSDAPARKDTDEKR